MGKLNFRDYKGDDNNLLPATTKRRNVIVPNPDVSQIANEKSTTQIQSKQYVFDTVTAITTTTLSTFSSVVSDITSCIASYHAETEATNRVRLNAEVAIVQAREATAQVKIHESETTKRFMMEMKEKLAEREFQFKETCKTLEEKYNERKLSHEEYMKGLESLSKNTLETMNVIQKWQDFIIKTDDKERITEYLAAYETAMTSLTKISEQIVNLKRQ